MWPKAAGGICCHRGGSLRLEERLFFVFICFGPSGPQAHPEVPVHQLGLLPDPSEVRLQLEGVGGWRRRVRLRQGGGGGRLGWRRGSFLDRVSAGPEERVTYRQT